MGRITLVCTAHREIGKCNEHELLKILLAIGPEVIFEEIRPDDFQLAYSNESKQSMEMRAVKAYLKARTAQQVPVDGYETPKSFGPYMRALEEFVASRSSEYIDAMDDIHRKQYELGFSYLNSPIFVSDISESERLYRETISKYGNELGKNKLAEWNDQIRKRDSSMLENIYRFCQRTDFMEAVFLVGGGHLLSIMDGVEQHMDEQPTLVTWKVWNGL